MTEICIEKINESIVRVTSEDFGIEQDLNDFFSFRVPNYQFMPSYKAKVWDGYARNYDVHRKTLPFGLTAYVHKFAENNECTIREIGFEPKQIVDLSTLKEFIEKLNLHVGGNKITLRDYQVDTIHKALNDERILALSPTSSGKSAIIYVYLRWHLEQGRRIALMVPTTSLVSQMLGDFKDYSSETEWNADEHCHILFSGKEKTFDKPVLITTWQSVHSMSKVKTKAIQDFYASWDVYIGDEAHLFASNSLLKISEKLVNAKHRLGTTGTIKDDKVSKLSLEGSFGPVHQVTTTRELMDAGQVVDLKIKCIMLNYDDETKKLLKGVDYQKEIDYVVQNPKRNRFIAKLAHACKGNTLVLFQFVEKQGKPIYELIKSISTERPVFYVSGEIGAEEREEIRQMISTHDNAIFVASYGTTSTGVNMPGIENIIFCSPGKSKIRNLQSIGRGLRLKEGKSFCTLYDIADNFAIKSKMNHGMRHFKDRVEQYSKEQFTFTFTQCNI